MIDTKIFGALRGEKGLSGRTASPVDNTGINGRPEDSLDRKRADGVEILAN
jgi:hypothetical protein